MHPFRKETTEIIGHLEEAFEKIGTVVNPDLHALTNKIKLDLKHMSNTLKLQLGVEPDQAPDSPTQEVKPLTKIFGRDVTPQENKPSTLTKPIMQTPESVAAAELDIKLDELYPKFTGMSTEQIIDSISDIELRGIAVRAGLPVTETSPNRIDAKFVEQIREAIVQQTAAGAKVSTGPENDNSSDEDIQLQKITQLHTELPLLTNKEVLENYSEIEIRGAATIAGLPVTETSPEKVDSKFITQIKDAIKKAGETNLNAGNY